MFSAKFCLVALLSTQTDCQDNTDSLSTTHYTYVLQVNSFPAVVFTLPALEAIKSAADFFVVVETFTMYSSEFGFALYISTSSIGNIIILVDYQSEIRNSAQLPDASSTSHIFLVEVDFP